MSTINVQTKISENKTKFGVIGLLALPIVAAVYSSGNASLEQVPQILSSGVFPVGFTILSWGLAVKMALKLRKQDKTSFQFFFILKILFSSFLFYALKYFRRIIYQLFVMDSFVMAFQVNITQNHFPANITFYSFYHLPPLPKL